MKNAILLSAALLGAASVSHAAENRAAWMKEAKYGVFVHFLPGGGNWKKSNEAFDVNTFASHCEEAGAGYVVFTLGQNSGYYCAPNATYEKLAGYEANTRCAARDLPMEIADALAKKNIKFMLYLPSRSPQRDPQAMTNLSDVSEQQPAPQEFTRKWSEVIREWSLRYGTKVSGWWFDGAYSRAGWDDLTQPYNWKTWAAACRAGNPNSALAFNPGTRLPKAFQSLTGEQDYTAGEQNEWKVTPQQQPAPAGLQWQVLGYLGSRWGRADAPRLSDAAMIEYIRTVNAQGGAVTMDVAARDGAIHPEHLNQLKAIKAALR